MWQFVRSRPVLSGSVVFLLGLYFAAMGAWLASLGGSWYYLLAGLGMAVSGVLIALGRRTGLYVYGLVWLGTVVWAVWESGLDPLLLMPRVVAPTVLGVYLLMPWITRRLKAEPAWNSRSLPARAIRASIVLVVLATGVGVAFFGRQPAPSAQQTPATTPPANAAGENEWRFYGRTAAGDRFGPQTQITPENVAQLEVAWTARSGDSADEAEIRHEREFHSEATPLKIGNTLYTCTPHNFVMAIDATTGAIKWKFVPDAAALWAAPRVQAAGPRPSSRPWARAVFLELHRCRADLCPGRRARAL
jgi:quinoprotein glucose dehydrogenase